MMIQVKIASQRTCMKIEKSKEEVFVIVIIWTSSRDDEARLLTFI
jgi:hypothetical protein